jgi:hypothetical protein
MMKMLDANTAASVWDNVGIAVVVVVAQEGDRVLLLIYFFILGSQCTPPSCINQSSIRNMDSLHDSTEDMDCVGRLGST